MFASVVRPFSKSFGISAECVCLLSFFCGTILGECENLLTQGVASQDICAPNSRARPGQPSIPEQVTEYLLFDLTKSLK